MCVKSVYYSQDRVDLLKIISLDALLKVEQFYSTNSIIPLLSNYLLEKNKEKINSTLYNDDVYDCFYNANFHSKDYNHDIYECERKMMVGAPTAMEE
jgi:hypothetical protein